jgi:hypothetical protein
VKAQQNEFVYLQFNRCGEDICIIPKSEEGRYHGKIEIKKYEKIKQVNGDIEFYICGELFIFNNKSKIETCSVTDSPPWKYSDIWELKKIINKKNILYPEKVFEKVFLVEKFNDSTYFKYDVIWQYYIE